LLLLQLHQLNVFLEPLGTERAKYACEETYVDFKLHLFGHTLFVHLDVLKQLSLGDGVVDCNCEELLECVECRYLLE
jgi:hypothetical protein